MKRIAAFVFCMLAACVVGNCQSGIIHGNGDPRVITPTPNCASSRFYVDDSTSIMYLAATGSPCTWTVPSTSNSLPLSGGTLTGRLTAPYVVTSTSADDQGAVPKYALQLPKQMASLCKLASTRVVNVMNIGTSIDSFAMSPAKFQALAMANSCGGFSSSFWYPAASQANQPINGWLAQYYSSLYSIRLRGNSGAGATAQTFNTSGAYFVVYFSQEADGGTITVTVDGSPAASINSLNSTSTYGNSVTYALTPNTPHTIVLTPPASGFGYLEGYLYGPTLAPYADGTTQDRGIRYIGAAYGGSALGNYTGSVNRPADAGMATTATPNGTKGLAAAFCSSDANLAPDLVIYGGQTNDTSATFPADIASMMSTCAAVNHSETFLFVQEPANDASYPAGAGFNGGISNDTGSWATDRLAMYSTCGLYPDQCSVVDWDYALAPHKFNPNFHAYTFTLASGGTGYVNGDIGAVLTGVQAGASGGTVTITSVAGGAVTGIGTFVFGTGYTYSGLSPIAVTGATTGAGATLNVSDSTGNPHPSSNGFGDPYYFGGHFIAQQSGFPPFNPGLPTWDKRPDLAQTITSATEPLSASFGSIWNDISNGTGSAAVVKVKGAPFSTAALSPTNAVGSASGPAIWTAINAAVPNYTNPLGSGGVFTGSWGTVGNAPDGSVSVTQAGGANVQPQTTLQAPSFASKVMTLSVVGKTSASGAGQVWQLGICIDGTPTSYCWNRFSQSWVASNATLNLVAQSDVVLDPIRRSITVTMPSSATLTSWVATTSYPRILLFAPASESVTWSELQFSPGASAVQSIVSSTLTQATGVAPYSGFVSMCAPANTSSPWLTCFGDMAGFEPASATYAIVGANSLQPMMVKGTSGAVSGNMAGYGTAVGSGSVYTLYSGRQPSMSTGVAYTASGDYSANSRIMIGMTDANNPAIQTASDSPAQNYAMIESSTTRGDTAYQCVTDNASGTPTVTPIGVAPTTAFTTMSVSINAASVTCTVNGITVTNVAKLPASNVAMVPMVINTTLTTAATHIETNGWKIYDQNGNW